MTPKESINAIFHKVQDYRTFIDLGETHDLLTDNEAANCYDDINEMLRELVDLLDEQQILPLEEEAP